MNLGLIIALIVLPGTALVFVPAIILALAEKMGVAYQFATPDEIIFWLAILPAGGGLGLAIWTVTLFKKVGKGTPAPWDPPKKLVVQGPYRYVRNPMIAGALFILLAETLLFQSWPLAIWMVIFFIVNSVYFRLIEEKGLEKRYGDDYRKYKARIPRWIPRLRGWNPERD